MCGRVSASKLCMDKLCCMHVRLNVCMYACKDEWMDGCMDAYIYMYVCMYLFIYVCMVGPQARLFFPQAERRHGRYEDGDEVGTWQNNRKLRLS